MCKVSSKKDEALKIIFSQGFNRDETEEITEAFSKIVPAKELRFATDSIEPVTTVVIIFMLGFITRDIAQGFFKAIGSDLYKIAKEKLVRIFKIKQNPRVIFKMSCKGTDILIECQTNDEGKLNEVFDTIDKARDIAIRELDKKETPEVWIYYDNGWVLDSEKSL